MNAALCEEVRPTAKQLRVRPPLLVHRRLDQQHEQRA